MKHLKLYEYSKCQTLKTFEYWNTDTSFGANIDFNPVNVDDDDNIVEITINYIKDNFDNISEITFEASGDETQVVVEFKKLSDITEIKLSEFSVDFFNQDGEWFPNELTDEEYNILFKKLNNLRVEQVKLKEKDRREELKDIIVPMRKEIKKFNL